jgi:Putative collagen-binding domain of a collagenase
MWNETAQQNRNFAWQNFMTGNQVLFMDPYVVYYPREHRNLCVSPTNAICSGPDTRWDNFRDNLGYILRYSRKLNLANVTPRNSLCSTGYCLAQTPSVGAEYLVYAPSGGPFTLDLSAMSGSRRLALEWFNPSTGAANIGNPIPSGSPSQSLTPPFSGDAVLYLVDTAGHATSGVSNPRPGLRRVVPR